jgi:hypothetical protein
MTLSNPMPSHLLGFMCLFAGVLDTRNLAAAEAPAPVPTGTRSHLECPVVSFGAVAIKLYSCTNLSTI